MQFSDSVRHDNGKGGENRGMVYEMLAPVMDYGLLRERFAALVTDGLRAKYLERMGMRHRCSNSLIWNIHRRISCCGR